MEVITKDMEEVKAYFEALERGTKYVDNVTANFHPVMNGEVYLTCLLYTSDAADEL